MEETLKSIGWDELYPETMNRLNFFKDGFRDYFSEDEISNKDLEDCVAYSFGIYGQNKVYDIYAVFIFLFFGQTCRMLIKRTNVALAHNALQLNNRGFFSHVALGAVIKVLRN